jgi:hypothetical protein
VSDRTAELRPFYEREGYAGPFVAVDPGEIDRSRILPLVQALGGGARGAGLWERDRHLDVPAIARLCRNETVVSCVRAVLGPDLLLWRSQLWRFEGRAEGLGWHRDEYRALLGSRVGAHCSAQISLAGSTKANCVTILPRSHAWDEAELRARGYTSGPGVEFSPEWGIPRDAEVLDLPMRAGEFFVFHPRLLHASVWARSLRVGASRPWVARLARWSTKATARLSGERSVRWSLTLRIATPDTTIPDSAFSQSPSGAAAVLLSGTDARGINRLGSWAEKL